MKQTKCFTLVELLTVIFVIGVLAGMIIPVTGIVRATAKRAACASNMRQVGVLALQFSNDRSGKILQYNSGTAYNLRERRLEKATRDSNMVYGSLAKASTAVTRTHWVAGLVRYAKYDMSVFYCPADERNLDLFAAVNSSGAIPGSYGLNYGSENHPGGVSGGSGVNLEKVQRSPAVVFYIGESAQGNLGLDTSAATNLSSSVVPDPDGSGVTLTHNPHSDDFNMCFLDGHVETIAREDYAGFLDTNKYHLIKE